METRTLDVYCSNQIRLRNMFRYNVLENEINNSHAPSVFSKVSHGKLQKYPQPLQNASLSHITVNLSTVIIIILSRKSFECIMLFFLPHVTVK